MRRESELFARLERGEPLYDAPSAPRTRQAEQRGLEEMPPLSPQAGDGRQVSTQEAHGAHEHAKHTERKEAREQVAHTEHEASDSGAESEDEESEYEVEAIDAFRRVGRKRGKNEYRVVWKGGEITWEPSGSFRLEERSEETGSFYLPIFDEFKSRVESGEIEDLRVHCQARCEW